MDSSYVSYAIPLESVKSVCDTLIKRGSLYSFIPTVTLSSLGKNLVYLDNSVLPCEIIAVSESYNDSGSLSLLAGDLLISANVGGKEYPIRHINSLREALFYAEPGDTVILSVRRGGVTITLKKKISRDFFGYIP